MSAENGRRVKRGGYATRTGRGDQTDRGQEV